MYYYFIFVIKTNIKEVKDACVYEIDRFADNRGYFQEIFSIAKYDDFNVAQVNISLSSKNVVRGLHVASFAKLCTCVKGRLFDVVADVRVGSETFGNWFGIWLDEFNCKQLFVPSGCAHGFFSETDDTILLYGQTGNYDPKLEFELNWQDSMIGIDWPYAENYVLSEKDLNAKYLGQILEI